MATKRCVIYTRISVAQEASVSLERQREAAEQYAAARNWQVVEVFTDDGVSASHNKPENRAGWRALLASPKKYDAVIIWKVDRLARRVLDFLHADEALQERKAGIVAVEDPVDMTTAQGRAFAQLLAVFGELEAATIRARVAAARTHLLHAGRAVGGAVPYGWQNVRNPDGAGLVLAQDPDLIDYVRGMAERALRGDTIYSIQQWLNEEQAPTPDTSLAHRKAMADRRKRNKPVSSVQQWLEEAGTPPGAWAYSTVERILRNPVLAGMTAFNPGNKTKTRGADFLRDSDGLPIVDESVAIMSQGEWRAMVKKLDDRDTGHTKCRDERAKTSPLLSGLVWCAQCEVRMHRAATENRQGYSCPKCHMLITNFEPVVVDEFLRQKGERVRWTRVESIYEGGAAVLPEIEQRLDELAAALKATDDDEQADALTEQIRRLRAIRREARETSPNVSLRYEDAGWFSDAWASAGEDVEARRAVLDDAVERIWVRRGGTGRRSEAQVLARLSFDWKVPEDLGPVEAAG